MGKYILFQIHQQDFALAIEQVDKILIFEKPTRIPDTQPVLLGLIDYEGNRLPVIDTTRRLFQEPLLPGVHTKIMVVRWQEKNLGLAVDSVTAVMDFDNTGSEIQEPQQDQENTRYLKSIFHQDGKIILHLDSQELLTRVEEEEILTILGK